MATNLDEMRALLLAVSAQLDQEQRGTAAAQAEADGNQLPELVDRLADHVVHPELLRAVLLSLDARLRELEQPKDPAPAPTATGAAGTETDPDGGEDK